MGDKLKINNIEIPMSLIVGTVIVLLFIGLVIFRIVDPTHMWDQLIELVKKLIDKGKT